MDSIAKRLGYFIDVQGIKVSKLEASLGFTNGRISKAIDRNSDIKHEVIDKIVEKFPHLSKSWLETGHGNMLVYENVKENTQVINKEDPTLTYEYLLKENIQLLRKLREYEQKEGLDLDKVIELKKKIDELTELLKKKTA
jgi:plasmid maintenance system antidote protein VapI